MFSKRHYTVQNEGVFGTDEERRVIDKMMEIRASGEFCFSAAYRPASFLQNCEIKYANDAERCRELYQMVFRDMAHCPPYLKPIHRLFTLDRLSAFGKCGLEKFVKVIKQNRSLKALDDCLHENVGFGKTHTWSVRTTWQKRNTLSPYMYKRVGAFCAKELIQDLQLTPLVVLEDMPDKETYCPIGPGAMKGLHLLFDVPPEKEMLYQDAVYFMRKLYEVVKPAFPTEILGVAQPQIRLHDVQSALCEIAKYRGVATREKQSRRRRYLCPQSSTNDVNAINRRLYFTLVERDKISLRTFGSLQDRRELHENAQKRHASEEKLPPLWRPKVYSKRSWFLKALAVAGHCNPEKDDGSVGASRKKPRIANVDVS